MITGWSGPVFQHIFHIYIKTLSLSDTHWEIFFFSFWLHLTDKQLHQCQLNQILPVGSSQSHFHHITLENWTDSGGWNNDKIKDIAEWVHTPVPRICWKGSSFAVTVICMHLKRQKLIGIRCVDNREPSEYSLGQEHMVHCFTNLPFTGSKISVRKFELIIKKIQPWKEIFEDV